MMFSIISILYVQSSSVQLDTHPWYVDYVHDDSFRLWHTAFQKYILYTYKPCLSDQ